MLAALTALASLGGCSPSKTPPAAQPARSWAPREQRVGDLLRIASTDGDRLLLSTAGGVADFVPGVNVGATVPGHYPGELAVPASEYRRWFRDIAALGLRSMRIYTLRPPAFYDELAAFNRAHPDGPLYLVQGVYLSDDDYVQEGDLFAPAVEGAFRTELSDLSRAVHGDLERPERPGAASGHWKSDVSDWLLAYPDRQRTGPGGRRHDRLNASRPAVTGTYFTSRPGATPTERWMAGMLDHLASEEAGRGRTMPLAFVNWSTTDPCATPRSPRPRRTWWAWTPAGWLPPRHGLAAISPLITPTRTTPTSCATSRASTPTACRPLRRHMAALKAHHAGVPVMITEFGVPSSVGSAHFGPLGRDQGGHSEVDAMELDADMLRMIKDLGMAGVFVFEWQDEWFKRTWNTMYHQLPADRRALWHDAWTNEQHFGLQAVEAAGTARPARSTKGPGRCGRSA